MLGTIEDIKRSVANRAPDQVGLNTKLYQITNKLGDINRQWGGLREISDMIHSKTNAKMFADPEQVSLIKRSFQGATAGATGGGVISSLAGGGPIGAVLGGGAGAVFGAGSGFIEGILENANARNRAIGERLNRAVTQSESSPRHELNTPVRRAKKPAPRNPASGSVPSNPLGLNKPYGSLSEEVAGAAQATAPKNKASEAGVAKIGGNVSLEETR